MNVRRPATAAAALLLGAVAVAGATANSQAQTVGQAYKVVGKWGKQGTGNGQFRNVFGLATDSSGRVYVADSDNSRVQVFSASGAFQGKIAFDSGTVVPDVAIDPEGNVWGTDDTGARAQRFTRDGRALTSLSTPKQALGIAVDAEGNVYVVTAGDNVSAVVRFDKTGSGYGSAETFVGGFQHPHDVEVSPDGSIWVSDNQPALNIKRFDRSGKPLKTIKGGPSAPLGIGVDLDCNLWVTNISQRRIDTYSPSGKLLATAASADLIAQDVAVGPSGDVYAFDNGTGSVLRFAEDKAKPARANVPGTISVKNGKATIRYTASGIACPAQVSAVASLSGGGVSGKAAVRIAAGRANMIQMNVKGRAGSSAKATFKIVLKTNGRPTTETRSVTVSFGK